MRKLVCRLSAISTPSQIGSMPICISTGPAMGTTMITISTKSSGKPRTKITSITTRSAPYLPPGTASRKARTTSSPPRPRNTSEKSVAPISVAKIIAVTLIEEWQVAPRMPSRKVRQSATRMPLKSTTASTAAAASAT